MVPIVIIAVNLDDDAFFFDTKQPICEFDGGDCCLADMKVNFCIRCACVNDMNYTTTEISRFTGYDNGINVFYYRFVQFTYVPITKGTKTF